MKKLIKTWFYYMFKEVKYIKNIFSNFDDYYVCKSIVDNDMLEDATKEDVLNLYGLQYNNKYCKKEK